MAIDNPAFRNAGFQRGGVAQQPQNLTAEQLQQMYDEPAATAVQTDRMTVEDTLGKSVIAFGILLVGAAVGWFIPALAIPAAIAGFVLALVNIFKKEPSAPLVLSYAGVQGIFVGGISGIFESMFPGIVSQALIGTVAVFGVTFALFASGKVRASARATKVFMIAMIGYAVFSLVNIVLMWTGANDDPWGLRGSVEIAGIPLGLILGVLVVIMAAYSLVLDFDFIKQGAQNGLPRKFGWTGVFGVMMTVVWLYLEILRMIAITRD
ncbi:Bax inhibitor-1/YccA family protein [Paramicrobacterium agarici]|uniref:Putative YccA/Bax inhibitor family protein n=1 Tax=Paramicrobacterium agarici TaxID=630514 RepID=A0A2A9DZP9_9MICO|nr:Bax inhibitor-1/YccA family protein [Microbacterium agarici]PFG32073.1 putative YccA/Bax inhibitor family protein [Microbacterium agarici]